jgi:MFS family permease
VRLPEPLAPLRDKRFAWYYGARFTSMAGSSMAPVALTFAVLHLADNASALAQVLAARMIPMIILVLLGGVISDRFSRTTVMQLSHGLTALTQGAAAFLIITGRAEIWMIIVIEALNGAVSAFTMPAMMGVVPQIVDRAYLRQANALLSFSRSGLFVVGPSIAALLVVTVGAGWALAVDAFTYLLAILLLMRVHLPERVGNDGAERSSVIHELRDGWSEFAGRTWLWLVVVIFGVTNAIQAGAWYVLGPVIAKATPGVGERGWGLILSAEAVGVLLMTVLMLKLSFRHPLRAGMLSVATFGLPLLLLGLRPQLWPLMAVSFVAGLGVEVFGVGWSTALHEHIPEDILSRVSSYDMLGSFVAIPVGMLLYGWLVTVFDAGSVLLASSVLYVTLAVGSLLSASIRNLQSLAQGPAREDGPTGAAQEARDAGR